MQTPTRQMAMNTANAIVGAILVVSVPGRTRREVR